MSKLHDEAAKKFGESRGWKLTFRDFGWKQLAGVKFCWHEKYQSDWMPPYCDHNWFFKIGRSPSGIVTFPYDMDRPLLEEFAKNNGLSVEFLVGDPNWYGFGTYMVVWSRILK